MVTVSRVAVGAVGRRVCGSRAPTRPAAHTASNVAPLSLDLSPTIHPSTGSEDRETRLTVMKNVAVTASGQVTQ